MLYYNKNSNLIMTSYLFNDLKDISDLEKSDIADFISYYGYGDCHLLSQAIASNYKFDIGLIKSEPSGMIIHSFVALDSETSFDAHGIDTINNTYKRYSHLSDEYDEIDSSVEILPFDEAIKVLSFISYADQQEFDLILLDVKKMLINYLKIDDFNDFKKQPIKNFLNNKITKQTNELKNNKNKLKV